MTLRTDEIQLRDPFVLPVPDEGAYYLFGSTDADIWKGPAVGFDCYRSTDLQSWEGPWPAFRPGEGFWADQNFWAPEVHAHGGRWYMFATFKADDRRRGTQVLVADTPRGPFVPHSDGPLTPADQECLDGTFHVDADGRPWMVFCHEWVQAGDGSICAVRLSDDLRTTVGEPVSLFTASQAPWTEPVHSPRHGTGHVTDGPFLHRLRGGTLVMVWASFAGGRYAQGQSISTTGHVTGPWRHVPEPLYVADGGHGMVFETFDERLWLTLHTPNRTPDERAVLVPLVDAGDQLRLDPQNN